MKKLIIIISLLIIGYFLFVIAEGGTKNLISPNLNQNNFKQTPEVTPAPPVAPKTFKFDRNTDLNAELKKVNPEVLDSDFN